IIIRQQRTRTPPRAKHLHGLFCRRIADKLSVLTWQHHAREYNKMADTLTNMAMDSRHSIQ
ncbi:hypothetical protein PHYSODRAFT_412450, partial [Phytophthora sojae]